MNEETKDVNGEEEVTGTENTQPAGFGYANMTPEQRAEALEKQKESMKEKWQDPVYKARVALGRHTNIIAKQEAALVELGDAPEGEEELKAYEAAKGKIATKIADSKKKVDEANAVIAEADAKEAEAKESEVSDEVSDEK